MSSVKRIDHVAIAVENLQEASDILINAFGAKFLRQLPNEKGKYIVSYFQLGENVFTLLQPTSEDSFIADHIRKRGQGLHHLGIEVDGIEDFVAKLEAQGIKVPVKDLDDPERKEVVLSPRDVFGVVLQLVDWLEEGDVSLEARMDRVVRFRKDSE
jgi:methylmalonyl-CoA/ethylmalonyl-CoA epimerase